MVAQGMGQGHRQTVRRIRLRRSRKPQHLHHHMLHLFFRRLAFADYRLFDLQGRVFRNGQTMTDQCRQCRAIHAFYGETAGVRIARKHIGWYIDEMPDGEQTRREINYLDSAAAQYDMLAGYLEKLAEKTDRWACAYRPNAF